MKMTSECGIYLIYLFMACSPSITLPIKLPVLINDIPIKNTSP